MDFSKLGQNERNAAIAAAVLVVAGLVAAATYSVYSMTWFAVIAALGLLFVVLQPQIAAGVTLPGSKGSLMLLLGGIAGGVMLLALLVAMGLIFLNFGFADVMFLVAVAAGLAAAWTGWQEFQSEGGKFQIGSARPSPAARPDASEDAVGTDQDARREPAAEAAAVQPPREEATTAASETGDGPGTEDRRTEA